MACDVEHAPFQLVAKLGEQQRTAVLRPLRHHRFCAAERGPGVDGGHTCLYEAIYGMPQVEHFTSFEEAGCKVDVAFLHLELDGFA